MQKTRIFEHFDDLNEERALALEHCLMGMSLCKFDKHCQLVRHLLIGETWFFDAILPGMHLLYGLLSCRNDMR